MDLDLTKRKTFKKGMYVHIRITDDKESQGYIKSIDTMSDNEKGIKVTLTNGEKGKVIHVPTVNEIKKESFKFYNLFFYSKELFSIYNIKERKYLNLSIVNKKNGIAENTIFIFTNREEANKAIELFELDNKIYNLNKLKTSNNILNAFKTLQYDVVRINMNRKLTKELFIDYENRFKSF